MSILNPEPRFESRQIIFDCMARVPNEDSAQVVAELSNAHRRPAPGAASDFQRSPYVLAEPPTGRSRRARVKHAPGPGAENDGRKAKEEEGAREFADGYGVLTS